jgi:hypothetical protein
MRRILVDYARRRQTCKRGGELRRTQIALENIEDPGHDALDHLVLDEHLERFAQAHPDKAQLVELRFFVGLTIPEIAALTRQSRRTVQRHWSYARVWWETLGSDLKYRFRIKEIGFSAGIFGLRSVRRPSVTTASRGDNRTENSKALAEILTWRAGTVWASPTRDIFGGDPPPFHFIGLPHSPFQRPAPLGSASTLPAESTASHCRPRQGSSFAV